ncbi:MAG: UvrD-helicase domain-containing protein, partial [Acidimicrobiales bacterium]
MFADGLNTEQQRAVDHDGRPLLVLAGAGTGKTATLAARVARQVGDRGLLMGHDGQVEIKETTRPAPSVILHKG